MNPLGPLGEQMARKFLEEKGYEFIEANFRTRYGEIDLIMKDQDGYVFVEVKTRTQGNEFTPNDELSDYKVDRVNAAIGEYLGEDTDQEWRAELAAVTVMPNGLAKIRLIEF